MNKLMGKQLRFDLISYNSEVKELPYMTVKYFDRPPLRHLFMLYMAAFNSQSYLVDGTLFQTEYPLPQVLELRIMELLNTKQTQPVPLSPYLANKPD